jgi:hypothetical protein
VAELEPYVAPGPLLQSAPPAATIIYVSVPSADDLSKWLVPWVQAFITGSFTATAAFLALRGVNRSLEQSAKQLADERLRQQNEHDHEKKLALAKRMDERGDFARAVQGELRNVAHYIVAHYKTDNDNNDYVIKCFEDKRWPYQTVEAFGFTCDVPFIEGSRHKFGELFYPAVAHLHIILANAKASQNHAKQSVDYITAPMMIILMRQYRSAIARAVIDIWPDLCDLGRMDIKLASIEDLQIIGQYNSNDDPLLAFKGKR